MNHRPHRISAIDIGSNAIRMIIGEVADRQDLPYQVLKKFRAPVRLGHDVFTTGTISESTLKEAEATFRDFLSLNEKFEVHRCRAVATSALREAKNQGEFIRRMKSAGHVSVEVISGLEEARLIHLAVSREVDFERKKSVLIDIGGGSVEITLCHGQELLSTQSFPLGTVRLLENLKKRNLDEDHLNVVLGDFIGPLFSFLEKEAPLTKFDFAVGTGGNLEALARLKAQLLNKTPVNFVSLDEMVKLGQILKNHTVEERIKKLGLRPDRADVILPALMVIKTVLRQTQAEKILIPGVGLRDGILWSILMSNQK